MSSLLSITPQQILRDRLLRKGAGFIGCISRPYPPKIHLFGFKDIQCWAPADPKKPHCFCHDCRELCDPDGTIDLELIQEGNRDARITYKNLLPPELVPEEPPSNGLLEQAEALSSPSLGVPSSFYSTFDEIPTSLPAPRARNLEEETPQERLKRDLSQLKMDLYHQLISVMDRRRISNRYEAAEHDAFIIEILEEEHALWQKIDAITILLKK